MPAYLKLLLRLFAFTALAFGGGMGVCAGVAVLTVAPVAEALLVGAGVVVAAGVPYGVLMTLVLGGSHVLAVRRLGYPLTDETLAVRQRRRLTVGLPFGEAYTLCLASVRHLGKTDVEEESDYAAGVILATKRLSIWSGGERIRFDLSPDEGRSGATRIDVESRPRMRTVMADFGASLRNVDAIMGFLLAHGAPDEGGRAAAVERSEHVRPPEGGIEEAPGRRGTLP
jgi:hypothetical protein